MTPETAEQVIRYILDTHADGKTRIKWFGGEPLLGVKTIDRVCEGLREAGLEYTSIMISNGSLITPEIVQKMAGDWRLSFIQISMDGAERDYIGRKRYYADRDDYHRVMNAVSMMSATAIMMPIIRLFILAFIIVSAPKAQRLRQHKPWTSSGRFRSWR